MSELPKEIQDFLKEGAKYTGYKEVIKVFEVIDIGDKKQCYKILTNDSNNDLFFSLWNIVLCENGEITYDRICLYIDQIKELQVCLKEVVNE